MEASASKAVFLSYASQDVESARRIAEALRTFGVEVWFDQAELRGGEAWDQKIRKQIHESALFLPLISSTTQERGEGYFRREWKLAVERTADMAGGVPFIVPVAIDDTRESDAIVPEQFLHVQWTRLPGALPSPQFIEQVERLLALPHKPVLKAGPPGAAGRSSGVSLPVKRGGFTWLWLALAATAVVGAVIAIMVFSKTASPGESPKVARKSRLASVVDAKSIAVLPFANMSPDPENAFFADGMQEDVITCLAKVRDLKVISRTSVLVYRDATARNLRTIAAELGVATVLEGSVRRAGGRVKVTAQLIDARTDQHLWAETYERDLTDVFTIQSSIAQEIAVALKATMTQTERALIERRPTQNQAAYDLYLQAGLLPAGTRLSNRARYDQKIALYEQAVALDPSFALAYAQLCIEHSQMYWFGSIDPFPERKSLARVARGIAQRLAPEAPETHLAEGRYAYSCENDWTQALSTYRQAEAGMPNDAALLQAIGLAFRRLGQWPDALSYAERSLALNPRNVGIYDNLVETMYFLRRYALAGDLARRALLVVSPSDRGWSFQAYLSRAQFAIDGDRAMFERRQLEIPKAEDDLSGARADYENAMRIGDYIAADHALAGGHLVSLNGRGSVINDPVALHRAVVARLLAQPEKAKAFADEAIVSYNTQIWTPRQEPMVMLGVARAHAYAGRTDEAVRIARAALAQAEARDKMMAIYVRMELPRMYLILGRREDALSCLQGLMNGPCEWSPNEIRTDSLFAQLSDDPRFEEILKSAKAL